METKIAITSPISTAAAEMHIGNEGEKAVNSSSTRPTAKAETPYAIKVNSDEIVLYQMQSMSANTSLAKPSNIYIHITNIHAYKLSLRVLTPPVHQRCKYCSNFNTLTSTCRKPEGMHPPFPSTPECWTIPSVGGFSRDLPFPLPFHSSATPCSPQSPSSVLKTSMLRAAQNFFTCALLFSTLDTLFEPRVNSRRKLRTQLFSVFPAKPSTITQTSVTTSGEESILYLRLACGRRCTVRIRYDALFFPLTSILPCVSLTVTPTKINGRKTSRRLIPGGILVQPKCDVSEANLQLSTAGDCDDRCPYAPL
ncbi:hypothetical protein PR048_015836 [Dryococelus australis]|uniref:Uncharacterized protein n=1 Tax=Dryococelus australis TaxID=614101 RepID=A0ABQ9HI17_9NEOP|nr:hypothetical protein PR048_015836 [Dryococelus australis]